MYARHLLKNKIAATGGVALSLDRPAQSENRSNVDGQQPDAAKAVRQAEAVLHEFGMSHCLFHRFTVSRRIQMTSGEMAVI